MKALTALLGSVILLLTTQIAIAAERASAEVECKPAGEKLTYDCRIMLKNRKSGAALEGAKIMIKADMPSMSMAHNIPPVHAMPEAKPGHYKARLELEMHGEWVLTMDISGPLRDRVVKKLNFGGSSAMKHDRGHKPDHKHKPDRKHNN